MAGCRPSDFVQVMNVLLTTKYMDVCLVHLYNLGPQGEVQGDLFPNHLGWTRLLLSYFL